jgi:hypothetical protein
MSRRGRGKPQTGISLFPFLAVLICTMGALIVLLLLIMQQARVSAATIARPVADEPKIDEKALRQQIEDAEWRRQLLEQQRIAQAEQLANQRLELAHYEDHIRRLQDKWEDLKAQAQQLQTDGSIALSHEIVAQQMAKVATEIEQAKKDLADARVVAKSKPRSFSIIPYNGPNGTSRRPIYIECTASQVIIQPEGFALNARDFEGSLGPGNPLDACLRAIREYLAKNPEFTKYGEPYPLLIVRPDGVLSYAAARSAMKSWDDEFGYELIEQETKLAYPAPDPTLRAVLERAVVDARRRQELLAAAAPSRYRGGSGGGEGGGGGGGPGGDFSSIVKVPDFGDDGSSGNGAGGTGGGGNQRPKSVGRGGGQPYNENYSGQSGRRSTGTGTGKEGDPQAGNPSTGSGQPGSPGANNPGAGKQGQAGTPKRPTPGGVSGGAGGDQASGGTERSPGGATGGASQEASQQASDVQPLAHKKGANWGLPNYTNKATGITRPIRIRIEADRLLLVPERGERRAARVVPIEGSITTATEGLVSVIWDEVEGWGIAVSNGYWKPVLNVEVAPGQDALFEQLQTLLDGSGLEVRRRSP